MCYDSRISSQHEHTLVPVLTGALDAASEDLGEQRAAPSRRAVIRSVSYCVHLLKWTHKPSLVRLVIR
jgi:hypothetical protein